jgi:hypothetical protein
VQGTPSKPADLRHAAEVFGDLADLKSPCLTGHSRRVAALSSGTAVQLRLDEATRADLEIAGHLHDVGRVAVSSSIGDKPGALTTGEWELVRLNAYRSSSSEQCPPQPGRRDHARRISRTDRPWEESPAPGPRGLC